MFYSIQLFAVGHEYGHIVAGHLVDAPRQRARLKDENDVYRWNHKREHDADRIGARLATHAMLAQRVSPAMAVAGSCLYLRFRETLRRALSVLGTGAWGDAPPSPTHPPYQDRETFVYAMVYELFEDIETVVRVQQWLRHVGKLIDGLEQQCLTALAAAYAKGVRPIDQWLAAQGEI
jgi:hypothetical protein